MPVKASRWTSKFFYNKRTNGMADRRRPIDWSPDARADLSEIWNYYVAVAPNARTRRAIEELEAGGGQTFRGGTKEVFDGVVRPRQKRKA